MKPRVAHRTPQFVRDGMWLLLMAAGSLVCACGPNCGEGRAPAPATSLEATAQKAEPSVSMVLEGFRSELGDQLASQYVFVEGSARCDAYTTKKWQRQYLGAFRDFSVLFRAIWSSTMWSRNTRNHITPATRTHHIAELEKLREAHNKNVLRMIERFEKGCPDGWLEDRFGEPTDLESELIVPEMPNELL